VPALPSRGRPIAPTPLRSVLLLVALLTACGSGDPGVAGPVEGPRDAAVDEVFADLEGFRPGAAVAVRRAGEVVHLAGYGVAHMDHQIPITPATVFDIASISKQFGALAALLLEADGRLDLDADVRSYVPEVPDFGVTITPRHLIHHTSGIRDWPHTMALGGVEMSDVISFEKILRMLSQQQAINFEPGSEYAYSNTGYNLLARVIEVQSGMSFRDFTRQRIFEPLDMTDSYFSDDYLEIVPGRAESYAPMEGASGFRRQVNQLTALASSSLHTTAEDFLKWMENYEAARVGGAALIGRMPRQAVLSNGDTIAYAHGLTVGEYRDLPMFGHGGSWAGYRTQFVRFPEQDLSIAVFCNVSDCDPAGRARRVAEVYLEGEMGPPAPPEDDDPEADAPPMFEAELRELTGTYRSPELDSTYELLVEDGRLVADHWRNPRSVLTAMGTDTFSGDQWWFPEVRFVRDRSGRVVAFDVTGARVRDLRFERVR